jgi:hypothetical protein
MNMAWQKCVNFSANRIDSCDTFTSVQTVSLYGDLVYLDSQFSPTFPVNRLPEKRSLMND